MFKWLRSLIRRYKPEVAVIGSEFAQALEADRQWKDRCKQQYARPDSFEYNYLRGDLNLISPTPNDLDNIVGDFVSSICMRNSGAKVDDPRLHFIG